MKANLKRLFGSVLKFANHDFFPQANPFVYWLKSPVGWVVVAIGFSIAVGLFIGPQGYILAAAFAALLVLGMFWPWISMKGIKCRLVLSDEELREGEEAEIVFQVQNYWPVPVFGVMVNGDILQELDVDEEPIAFSLRRVPAWSEAEFRIPVTPRRRGHLPSGDVQLSTGFPFGLVYISKPVEIPNRRLVWPACQSLKGQPGADSVIRNVMGSLCDRAGDDGEAIGVRDYRLGDQLKNVHWAQTVRSQRLMVRERQTLSASVVSVTVDLSPAHHIGHGTQSTFEWAIRITASVCWQLHQSGSGVRLLFVGLESGDQNQTSNRRGIKPVMDSLASLPTLAQAQQAAIESPRVSSPMGFVGGGQSVFIGTSKSVATDGVESQKFMIDLEGFRSEEALDFFDSEADPVVGDNIEEHDATEVWVTSPQQAADQLDAGWKRSFCRVAG